MARALRVPDESFRLWVAAFQAAETGDLGLQRIELIRRLRSMRVTRGTFPGFGPRYIHIVRR